MNEHISRRGLLAATVGAVGAGQFVSVASATQQEIDIYFDGATRAWTGREPSSIDGVDNPTLTLYEGETYVLAWQNVDAAPHNVVIENDAGDNLVETEIVAEEGAIQRVEFEATAEMVRYYCQVHPGSMEGEVEVVPPDSGDGIPSDTNVVVTDQPTETPEPTTTTPTPTTTTTTATAAPTTTESDGSDGGASGGDSSPTTAAAETTSESGPGLGVLAALAGVGSVAALLSRRSDE